MRRKSASAAAVAVIAGALLPSLACGGAAAEDAEWLKRAFFPKDTSSKAARPKARDDHKGAAPKGTPRAKPTSLIGDHFAPAGRGRWHWAVTKLEWTAADETEFGKFLFHIGESNCKTTHECLTSPVSNPTYHATNPPGMQFLADCADLPFMLRAYFAWKNGLPFSFSTAVGYRPQSRSGRSRAHLLQVAGRYHITPPGPDPRQALNEVLRVSTAHFRFPLDYDGKMLPDHYPVDITRSSIKAGTVIFDALGHINVVYKVTDDGLVHYIDGNPDNSISRGVFGSDIDRAGPETGAGFLRWRPQKLVGARKGSDGRLHGGKLVLARNDELPDRSDVQYFGSGIGRDSDWRKARFYLDGEEIDYYAYVRLRLAPKGYRFDPAAEVRQRVRTICLELNQRVDAVSVAARAGMPLRPQPPRLPQNIYVTQGDWETYATPSRDARLKLLFINLREDIKRFIAMQAAGGRHLNYSGSNLRADLKQAYDSESSACTINYARTDGSPWTLSFGEIKRRLFLMSFDPHHCVERRWGASSPEELSTCPDDKLKGEWYEAQQRLRNQTVRTIGDRMNFTLEDLRRQARDSSDEVGDDEAPIIEVASLLAAN